MNIYLFNDRFYSLMKLSNDTGGAYSVKISNKIVADIVLRDGKWIIHPNNVFLSQDAYFANVALEPYKIYNFTEKDSREIFRLIATPEYDPNFRLYDIRENFTIGSHLSCTIYLKLDFSNNEFLKLSPNDSGYIAETNSCNFFIGTKRVINGQRVLNGDCIFFYGLKVILIGHRIMINNPNNSVEIRNMGIRPVAEKNLQKINTTNINRTIDILPLFSEDEFFHKSPRLNYVIEEAKVEIDEPPKPEKADEVPTILVLGPQLTMASTSILSMVNIISMYSSGNASNNNVRLIISVCTTAVMLIGTLVWPSITRKFNKYRLKKKEQKRQRKYQKYLNKKEQLINFIKINQKQTLETIHPSPQQCVQIIKNKSSELWQRNEKHEDFLDIRIGTGQVKTKLDINIPEEHFSVEDDDLLFLTLKKIVNDSLYIANAPITYSLTHANINAFIGESEILKNFMDCLFLQIFTFHDYKELKVITFTKDPEKWGYLKTAPHSWDDQNSMRFYATTLDDLMTISGKLEKIFDARRKNSEEEQLEDDGEDISQDKKASYNNFRPYFLFFIDDITSVRNVPIIRKILYYKRNIGFSIITTSQNISILPNEVNDFLFVSNQESTIVTGDINKKQKTFIADLNINNTINMQECMCDLANIPIQHEKEKYELPKSISFLELYKRGRVEQLNSPARWSENDPSHSLSVPIGVDQNGEIFKMDIHEKFYGPHGLIAGTTGSGKSEWIITYILSLAVNFDPDEVQFVIIDYKGGGLAKSFENADLNIKLPHLAGTITNLDKSEIFRSISAIDYELKRRQAIFNSVRERLKEGSMDIYKYQQYYRQKKVSEPMSHLLIICDEFAELKQQEPDFMQQLISTSRIGRSLGVHLILATQKPSGVVNDQIWSNSKFKVCLKVQDKSDSNEILKKPDAAFLKQAGAFYIQVGNDDYYNLGQVAWSGAKYYPSDSVHLEIDESIQCIDNIGRVLEAFEEQKKEEESRQAQGEELLNVVSYLSHVESEGKFIKRQLWLENIKEKMLLEDLFKKYRKPKTEKYIYDIVIGEYDEPRTQEQGLLKINLSGGNIAIMGQADGSIEKLISTIIWSSICDHTPAEIAYYVIDFGTEVLKKFAKFPHVGEVVSQDEIDKVSGILTLITEEMSRRREIFSDYNGSFEYYNKVAKEKMNLMVVVINNIDIFNEALPKLGDILTTLYRDAPKYGIIFIVSTNTINTMSHRQLQFFNYVIPMQFSDGDQYRNITNCRKGLIPKNVIGRGICKTNMEDNNSYCEFQTAMIADEDQEIDVIKDYAEKCIKYYNCKVKQLAKIPDDISSGDLIPFISSLSDVPIGTSFYEKSVARYDFTSQKVHLIASKDIKGNVEFLYGLSTILSKIPNLKVRVVDMIKIFKKPILDIKFFNDNLDAVFAALEKDAKTRTEAQDFGINIIIGAGQYKTHLGPNGIEVFYNLFDNVQNAKRNIYVLVDDYDKIRNLKMEKWFKPEYATGGLWLGVDFSRQSLFEVEEILTEDKKYNYPGLAFSLKSKKYEIIKVVMDKDE